MLLYTFSIEMMSPQTTCGMYSPAQLQKYKYFTPRGPKVYPSDSTSSEIRERAEKQITVCWTENYTELLTTVYPTGFPMGLCLQYFKNKTELGRGEKNMFPSFLPQGRSCSLGAMLLYFGFLGVSPLEASRTSAHIERKHRRETNVYEAPQINKMQPSRRWLITRN